MRISSVLTCTQGTPTLHHESNAAKRTGSVRWMALQHLY